METKDHLPVLSSCQLWSSHPGTCISYITEEATSRKGTGHLKLALSRRWGSRAGAAGGRGRCGEAGREPRRDSRRENPHENRRPESGKPEAGRIHERELLNG